MKYAQVLVDVPTMQTNRPYTYLVPEALAQSVQLGMRVVVAFGRGKRKVQGIIVAFSDQVDFAGKVKPIDSIIDLTPVVDAELLELSEWLAETTFSFRISCLLTMLPSVIRAKAVKVLTKVADQLPEPIAALFDGHSAIEFATDRYSPEQTKELIQAVKDGQLRVDYRVQNRAKPKLVSEVVSALPLHELKLAQDQVAKNAVAQQKLIQWLIDHVGESIPVAKLVQTLSITNDAVNRAAKKGWVTKNTVEELRNPYQKRVERNYPLQLNPDQSTTVAKIAASIKATHPDVYLLEGVTGSGKTEVYLQAMQKALAAGQTALMLVPEIALTPQMVNRVKGRFGDLVAMLHSGLSIGEKYDEWRRIQAGDAKVVVGARSAVFAPLKNIGIIIMDEEHDSSYKQGDVPRYDTRRIAKWRGRFNHCPVVLGSATPALESRARASKGLYQLLMLPKRINQHAMPAVHVVDMRKQLPSVDTSDFSKPLVDAIQTRIEKQEQVVLMLNRRGYSSFLMCRDCGFVFKCPNCDISLTLHLNDHCLKCHYCGFQAAIPNECPNCHEHHLRSFGTGTERVEGELKQLLPSARVLRMDVDTTKRKGAHERILGAFGRHEADVLLGTQMIAKGLDFPNVTLVGVLNADTSLELPDFRANEKTFQLLTQVSGRAGRADKPGEVYIQTYHPDSPAIQLAKHQDYERFYRFEMGQRHMANYPPYFYTVRVTVSAKAENKAASMCYQIHRYLQQTLSNTSILLGPTPAVIARINNQYYYQLLVKYKHEPKLQAALDTVLNQSQSAIRSGVFVSIDPEPVNFM